MSWLFPGFLAGGLMIGLPIILHFLRAKPKVIVRFPTLRFLGESAIRDTRKHRLRRWLTLALRTLIIALLAAAFARPFWKNEMAGKQKVVIVAIDNSMSMQAAGRWEMLRQWALAQIVPLKQGDEVGLLLMNPAPSWMVPVTDDLERVRDALKQAQPGFETTHYAGALRMAGETLASRPAATKTIVWMADEQRLGWLGTPFDEKLPSGVKILFPEAPVSPVKRQAAITSVAWLPEPGKAVIEVKARLYSPEKEKRKITVTAAGKIVGEQELELQSATENRVTMVLNIPAGMQFDGLRVSLDADDLPADDTAWINAAPHHSTPVLYSPSPDGADFLAHALGSTRKLTQSALEAVEFPDGEWPTTSVAIVRNGEAFAGPKLERLEHFVAGGGALWIFTDGSQAQTDWLKGRGIKVTQRATTDAPWHLGDWDTDHPILAAFAGQSLLPLMDIEFYEGCSIEGDAITPVANWPDGTAAIAEWNSGGRRIFLCGFEPKRVGTDWPVQPTFVPFVHQGVRWLASLASTRGDLRVGDTIPLSPPEGTWRSVDSPRTVTEQKVAGSVRPDAPGLYDFFAGGKHQFFAVNTPAEESDLAQWPDLAKLTTLESTGPAAASAVAATITSRVSDEAAESQQRTWWWLLAFCCAAILAELALSNRTAM